MSRSPNLVVFMTDQQRGVTVHGDHPLRARTPHLDALAAEATTFDASSPSPHCCPSRASLFTGLHPSEHGVWNNVDVPNALSRGPRSGTPFWSTDLERAGYRLGFSGKWHVSSAVGPARYGWEELWPTDLGDGVDGTPEEQRAVAIARQRASLAAAVPSDPDGVRGDGEIVRPGWPAWSLYGTTENPFGDEDVVDAAVRYIHDATAAARDDGRPFALYVGTLGPHDPYTPPARFLDLYDPDDIVLPASFDDPMIDKPALYRRTRARFDQLSVQEHRRALHHYLAFCSYEDELFGRVTAALHETGVHDDTVVVYLSDHGDYTGEHGLWGKGLPSFAPAYHVPLIIKPAGSDHPARISDHPVGLVDLGPTLLELLGVDASCDVSGRSLAPLVHDTTVGVDPRVRVLQTNGNEVYGIQRTVETADWRLVVNLFDDDELYDRRTDPDQLTNLLHVPPTTGRALGRGPLDHVPPSLRSVVADLYGELWAFVLAHDDEVMNPYVLTALADHGPLSRASELG